jgi:hypothetical protein
MPTRRIRKRCGGGAIEIFPRIDAVNVLAVTHADGTPADYTRPAKTGEELVMWAVGLGFVLSPVPTGQATPAPGVVTMTNFQLNFDYRPNARPYAPPVCSSCPKDRPIFAGLTAGYAGLYQANFVVPPLPAGTPACTGGPDLGGYNVYSNLTVSPVGYVSYDGHGICVDTSGSPNPVAVARGV